MKKSPNSDYVFMQDGAPAHRSNIVQSWLSENMDFWPKEYWPPQSPDLNPLDYSIWWQPAEFISQILEALKASVNKEWKAMTNEYIADVCKGFRRRLEAVIAVKGGHIHK